MTRQIRPQQRHQNPILAALRHSAVAVTSALVARRVQRIIDAARLENSDTRSTWTRTNFSGNEVSLAQGPATVAGLVAGEILGAICGKNPHYAAASLVTVATAGAAGLADDLGEPEPTRNRGLRGHLRALKSGQVTTGFVKLASIATASGVAATILAHGRTPGRRSTQSIDIVTDTVLIAGMTNLINLLDLRPGRALKAASALAIPTQGNADSVWGVIGATAAADFDRTHMAGDAGANALGASIGTSWAATGSRRTRILAAAGVVILNLASEKVSFSTIITENKILHAIDQWGIAPEASSRR